MFKVEVQGKDLADLKNNVLNLAMTLEDAPKPADVKPIPAAPVEKVSKKKAAKKAAKKSTKASKKQTEKPSENEVLEVTSEQVFAALQKVNQEKGLDTAKSILNKYNANRISEVDEKDFAGFVSDCEDAIK